MRPTDEIGACVEGHRRMEAAVARLTDEDVRRPSLLPGWTRAHVLTHLADKTLTHVDLIEGAERNEVREQYPDGFANAQAAVDVGAQRPAVELRADLARAFALLEAAWSRLGEQHWDRVGICVPGPRSMAEIVLRHLRDVEVHHVDLDIGYSPTDWPVFFVEAELGKRLPQLADRAPHSLLLAWLLGRGDAPELGPW